MGAYDATIKGELDAYTARFSSTPGFPGLDPKLFKAVAVVESGGPGNPFWSTRPMQIGNTGDPAYGVIKAQQEGAAIIMDQQLKNDIATKSISEPTLNVRAGIAYILTRAASFSQIMVRDDAGTYQHVVKRGENFSKIASRESTTLADLSASNPSMTVLHAKDVVSFHHTHMTAAISGWQAITPEFLQQRYNFGDSAYAEKIHYVLDHVVQ